jgi:hypothetical protein
MEQFFVRLSSFGKLPRTLALCAFLLALPSLGIGMHADDFVLAQHTRQHPWDAFSFMPGGQATAAFRELGLLSWSTADDVKLHFLRPLSSLSHALDFTLWPDAAWLMHLENVLLYAALVWTAALLYLELLGPGQCAGLAAMFYAFSPGHGMSVGWIASRNTVFSAFLGLLSLLLYVRAKRMRSLLALAALCVHALALLAAEAAMGILGPLLAYAWLLDTGSRRARAARVLPHLLLSAGYLMVYAKLGYGAAHSGMYLNALQQPGAFVANLLMAVPLYLHSALVVPHAGLTGLLTGGVWLLVLATCCVLAALTPWFLPVLRRDVRAQFFAWSALGSILPLGSVTPQDRLNFFVGFGGCGLLSLCLAASSLRRAVPRVLFHLHTTGAVVAFVALCFVCCAPLIGGAPRAVNAALGANTDRDVVLLNAPSEAVLGPLVAMRGQEQARALRSIRALYVGGASYEVSRVDERTIDVHVARAWFRNAMESITRDPSENPFAVGDVAETDLLSAHVLEVDARGAPVRVRFQLAKPLEDPSWLWLRFDGAQVVSWTPPRIGAVVQLGAAWPAL